MSKDMLGVAVRMLVTLPATALGIVCDLLQKFTDPEWVEAAKRFLRKENPWPKVDVFATWQTLEVPVYKNVADIKAALEKAGCRLYNWAADILSRVSLPRESETVEFARLSVSDLGFNQPTKLRDILEAGKRRGLKLCLTTDGVAIRTYYSDQPMNEGVWLAMEPVKDSDGGWGVLSVGRDGGDLWLSAHWSVLGNVWDPENEFFFRK